MPDFRPTRMHPHRLCRPIHTVLGVAALFAVAGAVIQRPVALLFIALLSVISSSLYRLINKRALMDDALDDALGKGDQLAERPLWGAFAVAMDLLLALGGAGMWVDLAKGRDDAVVPDNSAAGYLGVVAGALLMAVYIYAHRKAVHAVRPEPSTKSTT